jgi:hypothetical protein
MSSQDEHVAVDKDKPADEPPDMQLAGRISSELASKDLLPEAKKASLTRKIATGQMHAEDWRVLAAAKSRSNRPVSSKREATGSKGGEQS